VDTVADLHEHQDMAFPVTDLGAYERRMRWRARFGGAFAMLFGFVLWGGRTSDGPTPRSAALAALAGAACGVALWAMRRARPVRRVFFPSTPRRLRDPRTWVVIVVVLVAVVGLYAILRAILSAAGVDLTFAAFGAGVWMAIGVVAILDAAAFGREKRERYEADLKELAALPSRHDTTR